MSADCYVSLPTCCRIVLLHCSHLDVSDNGLQLDELPIESLTALSSLACLKAGANPIAGSSTALAASLRALMPQLETCEVGEAGIDEDEAADEGEEDNSEQEGGAAAADADERVSARASARGMVRRQHKMTTRAMRRRYSLRR